MAWMHTALHRRLCIPEDEWEQFLDGHGDSQRYNLSADWGQICLFE
jgi:hypothetical protein